MKRTTSIIPCPVWFVDYSDCTIIDALLSEFRLSENNTLTLPQLNRIRVNGNALVGSYWHAIMQLRKMWFHIKTEVYHDPKKKITRSKYILENPNYCWEITD